MGQVNGGDEARALVVPTIGAAIRAFGALLSAVHPMAAIAMNVGGEAGGLIVREFLERRSRERQQRTERLAENLQRRVTALEGQVAEINARVADEGREDQFVQLLDAALADDEGVKLPFYEAAMLCLITNQTAPPRIRMIRTALELLSYAELYAYWYEAVHQRMPAEEALAPFGLDRELLIQRLKAAGLLPPGATHMPGNQTDAGRAILRYVDAESLLELDQYRQQLLARRN